MTRPTIAGLALGIASLACTRPTLGQIATTPTEDPSVLTAALHASGLTITSASIRNGVAGQFGTYTQFSTLPVTIRDGVVLSSGNVASIGPLSEALDPLYEPSSPPMAVNSPMSMTGDGGTPEFNAYGDRSNNIHNFEASYDVAALEVQFTLAAPSRIQFDFIFGSVEFPYWTNQFTDAFLVFLDGTQPETQIAFDTNNKPVQVGRSFANLTMTGDANTALAAPHGLIHHLTTTSPVLAAGPHTIIFEVGDVNDQALDSAVFIANFRTGDGVPGTEPSDDCRPDYDNSGTLTVQDIFAFLTGWFDGQRDADFDSSLQLDLADVFGFLNARFEGCP